MAAKTIRRGMLASAGRVDKGQHKNVTSVVYVSPRTPFVAALKRIDKKLALSTGGDKHKQRVRVVGMGRAIQNVMQVAAGLLDRNSATADERYSVEVRTISVIAVDEEIDEDDGEATLKQRTVPGAELLVARRANK